MHRRSAAPFGDLRVEGGETLIVGKLRRGLLETPGHTDDSISLVLPDRVLTGDALLIGGTGGTDLPTGDPAALHESLFGRLLTLDDSLLVFPATITRGAATRGWGPRGAATRGCSSASATPSSP
jgi:glyoxylase-like metal-dependent hydrolase (beta-lactamase superfamily II)